MKQLKKSGVFKSKNVSFDPKTKRAYSYDWWIFVDKIGGKVIFNNYTYSNTTSRHQYKVLELMRDLGIKIDLTIEAPKGLQDLDAAIAHYDYEIKSLANAINKPNTHRTKNIERAKEIERLTSLISSIKKLNKIQRSKSHE